MNMINYGKQYIDNKDVKMVVKACKSEKLTQGKFVSIFEADLKKKLKSQYCVSVNNGTAALYLAVKILNLKPGTKVLCSPITFLSSVYINLMQNLNPIFCDIDLETYNLDLNKVEAILKGNKDIKLIIFVDYAGHPCDWRRIKLIKKKYNIKIINDNCHALGAKYENDIGYAVKYADIVTQSFHPVKGITTGEGGAILTNNKKYFKKLLLLRNHGIDRSEKLKKKNGMWFYDVKNYGFNYRLTDIQSALGISQLKKLNKFTKKRNQIARYYNSKFKNIDHIQIPLTKTKCFHSYHLYPLLIDFEKLKISKKLFFINLFKKKILLQTHYIPVYKQTFMKDKKINLNDFRNTELFYKRQISLPIYYKLSFKELDYIIDNIKKLLKK